VALCGLSMRSTGRAVGFFIDSGWGRPVKQGENRENCDVWPASWPTISFYSNCFHEIHQASQEDNNRELFCAYQGGNRRRRSENRRVRGAAQWFARDCLRYWRYAV
jgi:hypothetical protein